MESFYLDHAATSPMHPKVINAMTAIMQDVFGNPSSVHSFGRKAHERLESAREIIAQSLSVQPHEIIFNSGGTEGDNTAIIQTAFARQKEGRHLITTAIEHPAVLNSMRYLEQFGFEVTYLPVDKKGRLGIDTLKAALRPDTILVSVMYGNNETGNMLPIAEIGELLREHPAYFHTDAVQAYGNQTINPHELGIDLLSMSAHKINGPKGVGFMYRRDGVSFSPFLHGGEQEEKRRAGTENLAGICGLAKAVELLDESERARRAAEYQHFREIVLHKLTEAKLQFAINGDPDRRLPHILNLHIQDVSSELLLMKLDLQGIAISTGSACTAGNIEPSHVLEAMYGKEADAIDESIRISFGYGNTAEQIETFADILARTIAASQKR